MDYTPNFHLPQWEKDDRVMMEDFNQMTSDLEAALLQNRQVAQSAQEGVQEAQTAARQGDAALAQKDAELAAKDAELSRLIAAAQQAADGAQQSANAAQTAANAAQTSADQAMQTAKGRLTFYMGLYVGTGGTKTTTFNGIPWVVFITGAPETAAQADVTHKYTGLLAGGTATACGRLDSRGFTVIDVDKADCPRLNAPNCKYHYVALCT